MARIQINDRSMIIEREKGLYEKIRLKDIYYIDVYRHEIYVHLQNRTVLIRSTVETLAAWLRNEGFIRIHRSYLVNGGYVERVVNKDVILTNGERLPISRYKKQEVVQACKI